MLLCYTLQQIEQFRSLGEEFAMQHADTEYMGELEEELQTAVLEAIPVERRLRGLPAEERLRGLPQKKSAGAVAGRGASAFHAQGSPSAIHARGACGRAERRASGSASGNCWNVGKVSDGGVANESPQHATKRRRRALLMLLASVRLGFACRSCWRRTPQPSCCRRTRPASACVPRGRSAP